MKIGQSEANRNSKRDFVEKVAMLSNAGASVIHVRTSESYRALMSLREALVLSGHDYEEWDIVNGFRKFTSQDYDSNGVRGDENGDIGSAISLPHQLFINNKEQEMDDEEVRYRYFVFYNPQFFIENPNPIVCHFLQVYSDLLPATRMKVILITDDRPMPDYLSALVSDVRFDTMGHNERMESITSIVSSVEESLGNGLKRSDIERISYSGAGMPMVTFDLAVSLGVVESIDKHKTLDADTIVKNVNEQKVEIVNKSDVLELMTIESMDDVGGMGNLKTWINKRALCYTDEAKEAGVEPPKGIVYVGIPGTGKSLLGKAIAGTLGIPLVKMDIGRLFNSLLGATEERTRQALQVVSDIAPVVLLIDEIDKGLGGVASGSTSSDGGASSRVLGTILSWLQDSKASVFTICTANNLDGLPPELLRKGRFDEIFYTGLPSGNERRSIIDIHLRKRGKALKKFSQEEIASMIEASNTFTGADIEQAIKDALVDAFSDGQELTAEYIISAMKSTKTLYHSRESDIVTMLAKAKNIGVPAGEYGDQSSANAAGKRTRKPRVAKRSRVRNTQTGKDNGNLH